MQPQHKVNPLSESYDITSVIDFAQFVKLLENAIAPFNFTNEWGKGPQIGIHRSLIPFPSAEIELFYVHRMDYEPLYQGLFFFSFLYSSYIWLLLS